MADWAAMVDARDTEIADLKRKLADCDRARESAGNLYLMFRDLRDEEADRSDRYRSAWLSARRRAADEANFGMEALELKRQAIARLRAQLADERKTFDAPRLEPLHDGEGGTVWQLLCRDTDGTAVYVAPVGTSAPKVR
ncbi:hypothetical protein M2271_003570 [Streptomyces sp. LBL]|uniref:hypothetical protein n=1 Tax=Streptomyces sp. LBL TaxID=2940562 RepID=UPI002476C7BC|nr:hypothetical protein [Streptomyces sp. LBL]MDH6625759.1 hypothetical protein [Streptomyces sp. LBL]